MKRTMTRGQQFSIARVAGAVAALACGSALAQQQDAKPAGSLLKINGGVSYGVGARATDPDFDLIQTKNAAAVGWISTNNGGRNQDDGKLNYGKNDVFTNVVTGFVDVAAERGPISGLVRIQGWHDFELKDGGVPWGHTPNGFVAGQPLSDASARQRGKFSNVIVSEAWLRGRFDAAGAPVTLTFGNQSIGWRGNGLVAGPMAVIDPADFTARNRPGGFAEQGSIPITALRLSATLPQNLSMDAFVQFGFRENQNPICGSFFAVVDRGEDGCNLTMVNLQAQTLSDREILASNRILRQSETVRAGDDGQFGISTRWKATPSTDIGIAFARYHSRISYGTYIKSTIPGNTPYVPGDARNPQSGLSYPEGLKTVALDFKHELKPATIYGSVGYTPNRPLAYPIGEITNTFVTPATTASLFRSLERAVVAGGYFEAFDRHKTSEWQLGGTYPLQKVLGASTLVLRGEVNARYVHDLPDPTVLRYARPEVFGLGPVNGTCPAGTSAITCSNDGYVTRFAWGANLQAVATYPNAISQVTLRPRVSLATSIKGYSYDGLLKEGRQVVQLGLDGVYKQVTMSVNAVRDVGKSTYDNLRDRNYYTASVAMRF
jgi:hypothetical protein